RRRHRARGADVQVRRLTHGHGPWPSRLHPGTQAMITRTLFVSVLAACSLLLMGRAEALTGDPTIDPCSLVSEAEVVQTIGKPKGAPRSGKNDRVLTC